MAWLGACSVEHPAKTFPVIVRNLFRTDGAERGFHSASNPAVPCLVIVRKDEPEPIVVWELNKEQASVCYEGLLNIHLFLLKNRACEVLP